MASVNGENMQRLHLHVDPPAPNFWRPTALTSPDTLYYFPLLKGVHAFKIRIQHYHIQASSGCIYFFFFAMPCRILILQSRITPRPTAVKAQSPHHWTTRELPLCTAFMKMAQRGDFPGDPVVKNLPSNAGDAGSIPGQGTHIPCAMEQLSPCASTTEPMHPNKRSCMKQWRSHIPWLRPDAAK